MVLSGVNQRSESSERAAADMMADPLQGSLNLDVYGLLPQDRDVKRLQECLPPSDHWSAFSPASRRRPTNPVPFLVQYFIILVVRFVDLSWRSPGKSCVENLNSHVDGDLVLFISGIKVQG